MKFDEGNTCPGSILSFRNGQTAETDLEKSPPAGTGNRTDGTDTLSYSAKEAIKRQLRKFAIQNADVVLEGDRINNRDIMEFVSRLGVKTKMYLVTCKPQTSMERLRTAGSTITPKFVKATRTKSKNIYLEYASRFDGEVINNDQKREGH